MKRTPREEFGAPGLPIPGSKFYRQYCRHCGSAIRVVDSDKDGLYSCDNCPGTVRDSLQAWSREAPNFRAGRVHTS